MTHEAAGVSALQGDDHILVVRLTPSRGGERCWVTRWARGVHQALESLADRCTVQIDLDSLCTALPTAIGRRECEQTGVYLGAVLVYEAVPISGISLPCLQRGL